ncbi:TPA: hypothetical protein RQJ59_001790 [Vibrio vulnificus]|nr:hypothetical protein [Vibrio vulnificus]
MSGKSTLEKLADYYNTTVQLNETLCKRFVEILVEKGVYFVICNDSIEPNTLLVATAKHNDYIKIGNGYETAHWLIQKFGQSISDRASSRSSERVGVVLGALGRD